MVMIYRNYVAPEKQIILDDDDNDEDSLIY